MSKVLFFIFSIILSFSCAGPIRAPSSAQLEKIDIIFDLDWTLVKQVEAKGADPLKMIRVRGEFYRLGDGAKELLEFLFSKDNIRVSFFSGGKYERNSELLKQIHTKYGSAFDNAYKVLSYNDLSEVSTDSTLAFSKRLKKDVSLVNFDLSRVLLIDDDKSFILNSTQEKNFLWLGETYKHFESYSDVVDMEDIYSPRSISKWNYDRRKLYMVKDILEETLSTEGSFLDSIKKVSLKWDFKRNQYTIYQKNFPGHFGGSSCSEYMIRFLVN